MCLFFLERSTFVYYWFVWTTKESRKKGSNSGQTAGKERKTVSIFWKRFSFEKGFSRWSKLPGSFSKMARSVCPSVLLGEMEFHVWENSQRQHEFVSAWLDSLCPCLSLILMLNRLLTIWHFITTPELSFFCATDVVVMFLPTLFSPVPVDLWALHPRLPFVGWVTSTLWAHQ